MKTAKEIQEIIDNPNTSDKARRAWIEAQKEDALMYSDMCQDRLDYGTPVKEESRKSIVCNRIPQPYDICTFDCECGAEIQISRSCAKDTKWVSCPCGSSYPTKHLSYDGYE